MQAQRNQRSAPIAIQPLLAYSEIAHEWISRDWLARTR
jgi:hypothetical protein